MLCSRQKYICVGKEFDDRGVFDGREILNMKYNLPDRILRELSSSLRRNTLLQKIILFGSRARGTNTERSDIDIAVYGGDFEDFYWDVKEKHILS